MFTLYRLGDFDVHSHYPVRSSPHLVLLTHGAWSWDLGDTQAAVGFETRYYSVHGSINSMDRAIPMLTGRNPWLASRTNPGLTPMYNYRLTPLEDDKSTAVLSAFRSPGTVEFDWWTASDNTTMAEFIRTLHQIRAGNDPRCRGLGPAYTTLHFMCCRYSEQVYEHRRALTIYVHDELDDALRNGTTKVARMIQNWRRRGRI